jgi:hypothetical protein
MWTCPKCNERLEDQFESCWKCAAGGLEVPPPPPRKAMRWRWLLLPLIVLQVAIVFRVSSGPTNLAKISYRRAERAAAMQAYHKEPTPENKLALDNEWRVARSFLQQRQFTTAGILLGVLFSVEGVIYYLWRRRYIKAPFPV